ncbi:MAG TPA: hypothetical protein VFJ58_29360 [Armatimonadota bacterium]|nr:hypothetical protein [Armatimonadota bacterium]
MHTALKLTARVLPGRRVEFTSPELTEGEDVELIVLKSANAARPIPALDYLDSLPPSTLTAEDWERIENEIQQEKSAWERWRFKQRADTDGNAHSAASKW